GPVAGRGVPPRRTRPGAPADPVDQLAFAPGGWPARLLALGEQRRQPGPLLVGEVSSSHAGSISRDTPTFETRPSAVPGNVRPLGVRAEAGDARRGSFV